MCSKYSVFRRLTRDNICLSIPIFYKTALLSIYEVYSVDGYDSWKQPYPIGHTSIQGLSFDGSCLCVIEKHWPNITFYYSDG